MLGQYEIFDGTVGPTAGAALTVTRASTNVLDLRASRDIGAGNVLGIFVNILSTFTAAGGATLQIELQSSPDNATFVGILDSPLMAVANLVAGTNVFRVSVPPMELNDTGTPNRYYRLYYTVGTGPFTAGTIFAYLGVAIDRQVFSAYPAGYSFDA